MSKKTQSARIVLLSGGGLDSTSIITHYAYQETKVDAVVHVDYGQVSADQEFKATRDFVQMIMDEANDVEDNAFSDTMVISLDRDDNPAIRMPNPKSLLLGTGHEPFIRGRNLWLLNEIAAWAVGEFGTERRIELVMGLCKENMMFSDADSPFIDIASRALQLSFGDTTPPEKNVSPQSLIRVVAPLISDPKQTVMLQSVKKLGSLLGLTSDRALDAFFDGSFTCWTPIEVAADSDVDSTACGACYHCKKLNVLRAQTDLHLMEQPK